MGFYNFVNEIDSDFEDDPQEVNHQYEEKVLELVVSGDSPGPITGFPPTL